MTNSSFMFGVMLGAFFLGSLADAVGRRKTLMVCTAAMVGITLASAASPSFSIYFSLRAAIGFFCGGYIIAGYVLMNELIGAGWRSLMGNLFQVVQYEEIIDTQLLVPCLKNAWLKNSFTQVGNYTNYSVFSNLYDILV